MEPLVDIAIATYNHGRYIGQAIESALMQQTTFPFRIRIGEDCSTDQTRDIVQEYASRYPDKIVPYFRKKNLGLCTPERNGILLLKACKAKYVALLDGDDYWTDAFKLQKQVDFLEQREEISACFHPVVRIFEDGASPADVIGNHPAGSVYSFDDMFTIGGIVPSSVMFRGAAVRRLPSWFKRCPSGDKALFCIIVCHGKFGYLDERMGVYRVHEGGIWSGQSDLSRIVSAVGTKEMICKYLMRDKKDELKSIKKWYARKCLNCAYRKIIRGQGLDGIAYLFLALRLTLRSSVMSL